MNDAMVQPFNAQIKSEFGASAQYIAIAAYFDDMSLIELAQFFYRQSEEERTHALKFVQYMLESGIKPFIPSVPELKNDFGDPAEAVQYALDQEQMVTDQINNLVSLSVQNCQMAS